MLEEDADSSFFSEDELTLVSLDDELAIVLSEEDSKMTSSEEEDCSMSLADEELSSPQAVNIVTKAQKDKNFFTRRPFLSGIDCQLKILFSLN